jgi:dihydroorotase
MPNLVPPLTSASDAMAYKQRLQQIDPKVNFLMTLYLHENITPEVVKGAKAQGIVGIKSYPAGVTTNSSSGVLDYEVFYPVFQAMEQCGMVLNLHGECPSDHRNNVTILNSESLFLPTLSRLHAQFPKVSCSFIRQGLLPLDARGDSDLIFTAQNRLGTLHNP